MKRLLAVFLIVSFTTMSCSMCFSGEWYPCLFHSHTTDSDGGSAPAQTARIVQTSLGALRDDGKCVWFNTDHFDGVARDFGRYIQGIRSTSISGKFIASPCLELGSKWRPEANTMADAHILAIGALPADFAKLADCYDKNTGNGLPLIEKFDFQQKLIDEILALGMLPVAAHPTQLVIGGNTLRRDNRFNMKSGFNGLRGVEMFNTVGRGQDDECVNFYLRLIASNLPVFVTAGADYHGTALSTVPDAILGSLDRVTWVYADDFTEASILRAIFQGKTYTAASGSSFAGFLTDGGQNPGLETVGVDEMTITSLFWLTGSDISIIVYRNGVEAARQNYQGSLNRAVYSLNGGDDFKNGWTDNESKPGDVNRYVVRVTASTKLGKQTLLITSPITLRLRAAGQTAAFFDAIKSGNLATVESELNLDSSLANARDKRDGYDFKVHSNKPLALAVACALGNIDTVRCLLDHGADPDCRLTAGEPGPLMEVALIGDVQKAQLLLDHGANINVRTNVNTPLIWAIDSNHAELAKFLVERGADVNTPGDSGRSPLARAKEHNMDYIARLLLARGAKE